MNAARLDRPVWAALSGPQRALSLGHAHARRYAPAVHLFAATAEDEERGPAAQRLAALFAPGERCYLLQVPPLARPAGFAVEREAPGLQLLGPEQAPRVDATDLLPLGAGDAAEMLALAQLTEPGPFLAETWRMGGFLGVRRGGRLVAMAGERMRPDGFTEISGVCTHPEVRGEGLARRLSAAVLARILARGERAFLHAWASNHAALALYRSLGFEPRAEVQVAVLRRV